MSAGSLVTVKGIRLQCKHCMHDHFHHQKIELERMLGSSFLSLEMVGKVADTFVCHRCGFLHWFFQTSAGHDAHGARGAADSGS